MPCRRCPAHDAARDGERRRRRRARWRRAAAGRWSTERRTCTTCATRRRPAQATPPGTSSPTLPPTPVHVQQYTRPPHSAETNARTRKCCDLVGRRLRSSVYVSEFLARSRLPSYVNMLLIFPAKLAIWNQHSFEYSFAKTVSDIGLQCTLLSYICVNTSYRLAAIIPPVTECRAAIRCK